MRVKRPSDFEIGDRRGGALTVNANLAMVEIRFAQLETLRVFGQDLA